MRDGQVISLPKGGGALQGIGETFSPDLHTGTGNFTLPVALPPGRNGFRPELNLVYSPAPALWPRLEPEHPWCQPQGRQGHPPLACLRPQPEA
jgi:hypothetical protein